jgi:YkoY family integral membrane protein
MTSQELIAGLWVIAGLVIIEGLLSVDNVLGIAALAKELPDYQQKSAIRLGLGGAYLFRVLALLIASWLISNTWVRWLGAGYLVWLMCSHLTRQIDPDEQGKIKTIRASFAAVLVQIGLMDLSLSIDNVIAAVGLAPKDPETRVPVMWPIYVGVGIAILALQAIAPHAVTLLKRYPILEPAAFVLIGYVGGILIYEETYHVVTGETAHIPPWVKFVGILIIICLALLYDRKLAVKRLLRPLMRVAWPIMKGFSAAVAMLFAPFKLLISALKRKPADIVD